jgi:hypothetical protein
MSDPNGIGNQIGDRWRGLLVFDQLPDDLQRAEDSTHAADVTDRRARFVRRATDAERTLLAHLGYAIPDGLTTRVDRITNGIVHRRWPQLETATEKDQP